MTSFSLCSKAVLICSSASAIIKLLISSIFPLKKESTAAFPVSILILSKQALKYINVNEPIDCNCALDTLNRVFKRVMQDKEVTQYYLRHTFATTCVQYVRPDIVDTWMGDSSERLVGRVYTHFPDKFMTNQMDLVQFEF